MKFKLLCQLKSLKNKRTFSLSIGTPAGRTNRLDDPFNNLPIFGARNRDYIFQIRAETKCGQRSQIDRELQRGNSNSNTYLCGPSRVTK